MQDGKVAPFRKSEPVPEANDQPVKVVVADNFEEIVFKSGKNGTESISSLVKLLRLVGSWVRLIWSKSDPSTSLVKLLLHYQQTLIERYKIYSSVGVLCSMVCTLQKVGSSP